MVIEVIVIVVILAYCLLLPHGDTYTCPNCKTPFKRAGQSLISIHFFDRVLLKCPNCGKTAMMKRSKPD
jgi:predicted RNA-binding Zn-ribbon protein involved in translation (DUF1610 family)